MMKRTLAFFISCAFSLSSISADGTMTPAELEKWFYEDDPVPPVQVDEGELVFLQQLPDRPLLHSINEITIDAKSIENGWVRLKQCYRNLDQVAEMDITYRYRFMRNLKISSMSNIGSASAVEQVVGLEDVGENAEICVDAEVRVFYPSPDGTYSLVNGPYHRKFLDGYFPYHVTLIISYPEDRLEFIASRPVEKDGFKIKRASNRLMIDVVFAGTLNTEILFRGALATPGVKK